MRCRLADLVCCGSMSVRIMICYEVESNVVPRSAFSPARTSENALMESMACLTIWSSLPRKPQLEMLTKVVLSDLEVNSHSTGKRIFPVNQYSPVRFNRFHFDFSRHAVHFPLPANMFTCF